MRNRNVKIYIRDGRSPVPINEHVSRTMSAIQSRNTGPELLARKLLRVNAIKGFETHLRYVPGRPDIAFKKTKTAVFIHGCYWHGCPYCRLQLPKTHRDFWKKKIEANKLRDARKNRELRRLGWRTVTVWACRLKTESRKRRVLSRIRTAFRR